MKSFKTTLSGAVMILGAVVHLVFAFNAGTISETDIMGAVAAVSGGVGLIFARDANVTSEQQGLKP